MSFLIDTPMARALGWTIFHSLWEGALIAIALAAILVAFRSPRARYAAACLALIIMLAACLLTLLHLTPDHAQGSHAASAKAFLAWRVAADVNHRDSSQTAVAAVREAAPVVTAPPAATASLPATATAPVATPALTAPGANSGTVLYAQPTATGFQLIDTSPKIVLSLLKTSAQDVYIADGSGAHGVVLKVGGSWYFESYKEGKLERELLQIKF